MFLLICAILYTTIFRQALLCIMNSIPLLVLFQKGKQGVPSQVIVSHTHSLTVLNLLTSSQIFIIKQRSFSTFSLAEVPLAYSLLSSDTGVRVEHTLQPSTRVAVCFHQKRVCEAVSHVVGAWLKGAMAFSLVDTIFS